MFAREKQAFVGLASEAKLRDSQERNLGENVNEPFGEGP
jgi:hypothetical protein